MLTPPPCPALADSRAWPRLPARAGPLPGRALFTRWPAGSSVNHPSPCGGPSRGWSVRWTLPLAIGPRPATRPLAGSWAGSPARATARSRANEQIRISTPLVGPQAAHPLRDAEAPPGRKPRGSRSPLSYIPSRGQVRAPHGAWSPPCSHSPSYSGGLPLSHTPVFAGPSCSRCRLRYRVLPQGSPAPLHPRCHGSRTRLRGSRVRTSYVCLAAFATP